MDTRSDLQAIIERCRSEPELDRQVEFLRRLNRSLPSHLQIAMPSLLTDDFVHRALDKIEEKITWCETACQH